LTIVNSVVQLSARISGNKQITECEVDVGIESTFEEKKRTDVEAPPPPRKIFVKGEEEAYGAYLVEVRVQVGQTKAFNNLVDHGPALRPTMRGLACSGQVVLHLGLES